MVSASAPDVESIRAPATSSAPMPRFFKMLSYPVLRSRPNFSDSDSDSDLEKSTPTPTPTPTHIILFFHMSKSNVLKQ